MRDSFPIATADRARCEPYVAQLAGSDAVSKVDDVVLAFNWDDRGIPFIGTSVAELHKRGVKRVFVVGRKSQGSSGPDIVLKYGMASGMDAYSASRKTPIAWAANAKIAALHGDFTFIDLMSEVCPSERRCRVLTDDKDIIFFDGSHFTPDGARYIGRRLAQAGAFRL